MRQNLYHRYVRLEHVRPLTQRESNWVGEPVYRCGFSAVELSLGLLDALAADQRAHVAFRERTSRLVDGVIAQLDLVARGLALAATGLAAVRKVPFPSRHSRLLRSPFLEQEGNPSRRLASGIRVRLAELPAVIGLEGARDSSEPSGYLPYDEWTDARDLWERASAEAYGIEDLPFRAIHQTLECWFQVLLATLQHGQNLAEQRRWRSAAECAIHAGDVFHFLADHIRILDFMDLAEYHPIRVVLTSVSGAQSEGAHRLFAVVRRQFELYAGQSGTAGSLGRLLRRPADFPDEYLHMEALGRLESAFADFLYSHYYRALRVQSRRGLGSLGGGTKGLLARALEPLFPGLDQARFEHVLFNNWKFAPIQGTLVDTFAGVERAERAAPALDLTTRERALDTARQLRNAFENNDRCGCTDLFAKRSGQVFDPRGSRPFSGAAEIGKYFDSVFQSLRIERARLNAEQWVEDRLVEELDIDVVAATGKSATLAARWELAFDANAEIDCLTTNWNSDTIAELVVSD